jgi:hypothetical protein
MPSTREEGRMNDCPKCGLTNRPTAERCARCERPLMGRETAVRRKEEWDKLPAPLQDEYAAQFDRYLSWHDEHRQWLRSHRILHAILGALVCGVANTVATQSCVGTGVGAIVGAAAAVLLNRWKGGSFLGLATFLVAGFVGGAIAGVFAFIQDLEGGGGGAIIFFAGAICAQSGFGYLLGMKFDFQHFERSVHGA